LRCEHGFAVGHAETRDALRAAEVVGIADRTRFRVALRLVCCAAPAHIDVFDRAFDAFFAETPRGSAQPAYRPRHFRPGAQKPEQRNSEKGQQAQRDPGDDGTEGDGGKNVERRAVPDPADDATVWQTLRARYSAVAAATQAPQVAGNDRAGMLRAANRLVASLRLGRSRRWRAMEYAGRFDLRRTIRASLQTGGEPIELRFLGHPLRNPRFVVLIDGSRSISERTGAVVQFAAALCERSSRAEVFFFSTELRNVTRALLAANRTGAPFPDLGEAWGGGTKIGASLNTFVIDYGARLLTPETLVIVFSDGLDVGELALLERAMREIERRSAAVVWLNPHAASPAYAPTARGMRAALPFVTILTAANDVAGFERLALRLARTPRVRGRRH